MLGVVLAPSPTIVAAFGLDVVFPAFFLVLLIDELRGSRQRAGALSAVLGAATSGVLVVVVPRWGGATGRGAGSDGRAGRTT